jgi:hypothetical protein
MRARRARLLACDSVAGLNRTQPRAQSRVVLREDRKIGREGVQTEAVMASVKREEFEIRSELEVVHIPTGAVFSAYPYSDPDDMLQSIKVQWRTGSPASTGDYAEQVRRMASQLLLEQAPLDD